MVFRVFLAIIALSGAYIGYSVIVTYLAQSQAVAVQPGFARAVPEANLGVIEYLDYSCPTCQLISPIIAEAVRVDGRVNFTVKPVDTGFGGGDAARLVYAAGLQGKYMDAHDYVMAHIDQVKAIDEGYITAMAQALEIDQAQLTSDMNARATAKVIKENRKLMTRIGGQYYPTFLIGPELKAYGSESLKTPQEFVRMFDVAREFYERKYGNNQ